MARDKAVEQAIQQGEIRANDEEAVKNIRESVSAINPNDLSPPPSYNSDDEQDCKRRQISILARFFLGQRCVFLSTSINRSARLGLYRTNHTLFLKRRDYCKI